MPEPAASPPPLEPGLPGAGPRALAVLAITAAIVAAFVVYVLYARGAFERTQSLVFMADDGAGVTVGMDLTFSGFPVGRVQRIELAADGKARIEVDVPEKDAKWLRDSSVFTLERNLVGASRLRAFTGNLDDKPLPRGAVRPVLRGDATEELPALIAAMKRLLENLERMTDRDSSLNASFESVRKLTERMSGPSGALGGLLGSEENARKVIAALDRANATLASLEKVSARLDAMLGKADENVFGAGGVMEEARKTIAELNAALGQAREGLKKADAILADAQKVSASAREATSDLGTLRAEVEASLRRVNALIDEINRKWPFARDTEVKLP